MRRKCHQNKNKKNSKDIKNGERSTQQEVPFLFLSSSMHIFEFSIRAIYRFYNW